MNHHEEVYRQLFVVIVRATAKDASSAVVAADTAEKEELALMRWLNRVEFLAKGATDRFIKGRELRRREASKSQGGLIDADDEGHER